MFSPIGYVKEVMFETQKVSWPSKQLTIELTALVVVVSAAVAAYLGGLDFIFTQVMAKLIG